MFEEFGYNPELIERYLSIFGEKFTKELLEANDKPLCKAIRINLQKIGADECIKRLEEKGFVFVKVPWCSYSFWVKKERFSIGAATETLLGYCYLQEPTSLIPVLELNPKPGEIVADLTAAPGGKTTHLSQLMENKGTIFAIDINQESMNSLRSNLQRMGSENVILLRMDSRKLRELNMRFDKILLDAPCTGEGTIIRDKQRRKSLTVPEFEKFSKLQKELLDAAYNCLKPNGILVYSTCSLAPEENEENVMYAVKKLKMQVLDLENRQASPGLKGYPEYIKKCGRFYPNIHGTQGFFVAKLLKS